MAGPEEYLHVPKFPRQVTVQARPKLNQEELGTYIDKVIFFKERITRSNFSHS